MYQSVQASLLSHSRALRLSTLQLLSRPIMGLSLEEREVMKRCLQAEEVSLDVQGVRERTYRIQKMAQVVPDGDELAADVCTRWLIGMWSLWILA
jgi:U3 small nucleolar RNA-associated protein 20